MSPEEEKIERVPEAARSAFEDYLGRRGRGEEVDFQAFCAERPDLAMGLKLLHSLHQDAGEPTLGRLDTGGLADSLLPSPSGAGGVDRLCPGERIGPYRILKELGRGGMGAVFLAEQERPVRRQVALKVIKLGMDTSEVVARFEAERQALALMDHPNIARVLDAGATEKGRPYFVMEHVPGVPLTDYCDRHQLDIERRLALLLQVCEGVQHAHQKGIIHRDLKPSNVLVAVGGGDPTPKIIDFGVAKAVNQRLTERSLYTEIGQILGTPEYMSPEQAEMSALDIDTRTDIYSLGVLFYELLTGLLPFDPLRLRQGGYATIQRVIREEEPAKPSTRLSRMGEGSVEAAGKRGTDPRSLLRQIRGDLDWITMKAMAKDRTQRYASASELAADIRRYLRSEPLLAAPPGAAYRLRKFLRRHRLKVALSATVTLLLAGMAAATWLVGEARLRRDRLRTSEGHHRDGQALAREYAALRDQLPALERRLREAARKHELWKPVWDREDEIEAWEEQERKQRALEDRFSRAVLAMTKAVETAPPDSPARREALRSLEDLYWDRHREGEKRQEEILVTPEHYQALVQSLGLGTYSREIEGAGRVSLESDPPGAEVYCFRYEEHEQHLVPIPFDPARGKQAIEAGLLAKPFLEVEKVWNPDGSPFHAGDRLLSLMDRPVSLLGDVARALRAAAPGENVKARVRRSGREVMLDWIATPAAPDGGALGFRERFGFTFTGYPLEFSPGCRVGTTGESSPLAVDLPRGSYLLVFRKEGHRDVRFPLAVPGQGEKARVRLLGDGDLPPGYVFIPAGSFHHGGDRGAFQSLEAGEAFLDDFFIGRFEVTVGEYLEFVNDPEVLERTDENGEAPPSTEAVRRELEELGKKEGKVWLIPKLAGKPRWARRAGEVWTLTGNWRPDWPMLDVTHLAALEYAAWLSRREAGPWRYRLPSDLEWEKAARGADRRIYVWGNYMVWSFCWSLDRPGKQPAPAGVSPLDESVYGVRDLAGSVNEHTTGKPVDHFRFRYRSLRGGGWNIIDEYYYRVATRNGRYPEDSATHTGFRLVAERK